MPVPPVTIFWPCICLDEHPAKGGDGFRDGLTGARQGAAAAHRPTFIVYYIFCEEKNPN